MKCKSTCFASIKDTLTLSNSSFVLILDLIFSKIVLVNDTLLGLDLCFMSLPILGPDGSGN